MTRFRHKKGAPKPLLWYGDDPRMPGSWERRIAPAVHSWYAYRHHEDTSSWSGGLAMRALASGLASLSLCFSSVAVHPPSTKRVNGPFFFLACVTRPITVCGLPCFVLVPARYTSPTV